MVVINPSMFSSPPNSLPRPLLFLKRAGQILVTSAVREQCENAVSNKGVNYDLKGFAAPTELYDAAECNGERRV